MTNDSHGVNSSFDCEDEQGISEEGGIIFAWIIVVLSLPAFIYGVISWCLLKKFRHYRNYVLVNLMLTNGIRYCYFLFDVQSYCLNLFCILLDMYIFLYCALVFNCWLLVLCCIFYVDFVKVFNLNIRRRFLKSSLFAWGVPFITVLLYFLVGWLLRVYYSLETLTTPIAMCLLLLPVVISLVIYVTVVHTLCCGSDAGGSTSINKWRRFYVATLIFMLSDIVVLYCIEEAFGTMHELVIIIGASAEILNTFALAVYFIIVKSNRELWGEYFKKRSALKSLEMK